MTARPKTVEGMQADLDQHTAAARDDAAVLVTYFLTLIDGGIPKRFAMALTHAYATGNPTNDDGSE